MELMAPTVINIVCFRFRLHGADEAAHTALNTEIMLRMQEAGTAVVTDTTIHGRHCLRAAVNNHRHCVAVIWNCSCSEVTRLGRELAGGQV